MSAATVSIPSGAEPSAVQLEGVFRSRGRYRSSVAPEARFAVRGPDLGVYVSLGAKRGAGHDGELGAPVGTGSPGIGPRHVRTQGGPGQEDAGTDPEASGRLALQVSPDPGGRGQAGGRWAVPGVGSSPQGGRILQG